MVLQWRKLGRQYNVVANTERFAPEGTPFNVLRTPSLKLLTEGVPKLLVMKLRAGENSEHPNY